MRILMVSDTYFPRVSGVASSIRSFRSGLARLGHEVDLLIPAYGQDDVNEPGILHATAWRTALYPEERIMSLLGCARAHKRMKERNYDVIHIHTPFMAHVYGSYLARKWRIPAVVSYHTHFEAYVGHYYPWVPKAFGRRLVSSLSRRQCNIADTVIVPSAAMERVIATYGVRTRVRIIPTGIDISARSGDGMAFRSRYGVAPAQPLLLYAGRLAPEKNVAFLLDVVGTLRTAVPNIVLLIAGDGPARSALEAYSRKHGLTDNARFLGYVDRDTTLKDAYRAADLFVFASQTETQGMVLVEALAAGLPIVAIPALGVADLLAAQEGTRSSTADPGVFSTVCLSILRNTDLRARLAAEASRHAMRLSQDAMSRRLSETYAMLMHDRQAVEWGAQEP